MANPTVHKLECWRKMQLQTPCRHTHIRVSPSPYTWPHLLRFNTTEKPPNTGDSRRRMLAPPTLAAALSSTGLTVARPRVHSPSHPRPSARTHVRPALARQQPAGKRGSGGWGQGPAGGRARRGAGPRRPGRGLGAGAGRRPAHVGGREQLKVRSGAWAVLSRAALAGAAAEEARGGGGGGERGGEDGGGVGLEPIGGASCPGRSRELARRAPTPELHPAVPSSAGVRAPAASAPGLPPE